jgi:hypothetical protein
MYTSQASDFSLYHAEETNATDEQQVKQRVEKLAWRFGSRPFYKLYIVPSVHCL